MSATPDDKRAATSIVVSTSSGISAAALAALAVLAAVLTFLLDNYDVAWPFYLLPGGSALALLISFHQAGKGTAYLAKQGASGTWLTKTPKKYFGKQASFAVAGVALLFMMVLVGVGVYDKERPDEAVATQRTADALSDDLAAEQRRSAALEREFERLERRVARLSSRVASRGRP